MAFRTSSLNANAREEGGEPLHAQVFGRCTLLAQDEEDGHARFPDLRRLQVTTQKNSRPKVEAGPQSASLDLSILMPSLSVSDGDNDGILSRLV